MSVFRLVCLIGVFVFRAEASVPLTFDLDVGTSGVAIQFDVSSEEPLQAIGEPEFDGTSNHRIQSATLSSGVHRFVIYSLDGQPISQEGMVHIRFEPTMLIENGSIQIKNVQASDATGAIVTSEADALPLLVYDNLGHHSFDLSKGLKWPRMAVDLDGAIQQISLYSGDTEVDSADNAPFLLSWSPNALGTYRLSLTVTDSADKTAIFDLGTFRGYNPDEITDYAGFSAIHFGNSPIDSAYDVDSLGIGFANGLAYLLGINPHSPDPELYPKLFIEKVSGTSANLVMAFRRRSNLDGFTWGARVSESFDNFQDLTTSSFTEVDDGDGWHSVEIRLPIEAQKPRQYLGLTINQP